MSYTTLPKYLPLHVYLFTGSIADIPSGMQLCDGTNGTVDLRNRFVVCANADDAGVAKSTIDGSAAVSGGAASKSFSVPNAGWGYNAGVSTRGTLASASNEGNDYSAISTANAVDTIAASIINPFYALAYIQRIGG